MDKTEQYMLAGMIQDVGNNFLVANTNREDRKFARDESKLAYERSLEHWHQVNAYNTPAAQMARYQDAGLNKNLIYGNMNNTPATNSVNYNPAKGSYALPGSKIEHSRFLQASNQQRQVDQQIKYQTQLMEQTVRMNEHQIQRMAIQNANMEADTLNKGQDLKNKILVEVAKSLGLRYDYGRNPDGTSILHGNAREWGMKDYDRQYAEQRNHQLANSITMQLQDMSLKQKQLWWAATKNRIMRKYGTNIDKDPSYERKIIKIFDELF